MTVLLLLITSSKFIIIVFSIACHSSFFITLISIINSLVLILKFLFLDNLNQYYYVNNYNYFDYINPDYLEMEMKIVLH